MAAKTATRKATATKTREAVSAEVSASTTAEAAGRDLANFLVKEFRDAEVRIFEIARVSHGALLTGAKPNEIASSLASHAAKLIADPAERDAALKTSVSKGGVSMTGNAVKQYVAAWASILRAGIVPTSDVVAVAFRAYTSAGAKGLAESHNALIAETLELDEAERADFYKAEAYTRAAAIKSRKKEEHAEKSASDAADDKAENVSASVTLDTVGEVIGLIRAEVARPWSDDDKALLMAALEEIVASA